MHDLRQIGAPETANLIRHLETFIKTDSYEEAIEEVKKLGPTKRGVRYQFTLSLRRRAKAAPLLFKPLNSGGIFFVLTLFHFFLNFFFIVVGIVCHGLFEVSSCSR